MTATGIEESVVSTDRRPYDIVVFGASGFAGRYVMAEVVRVAQESGGSVKAAAAGRDMARIRKTMSEVYAEWPMMREPIEALPIITADVADAQTLLEMASKTRLIINCVGPYRLYGEAVVKACIQAKTDYVDICGEPAFIEGMMLRHNAAAEANGVLIVSACGFDSMPADIGVRYTISQMKDDRFVPCAVQSVLRFKGPSGIHSTTLECAVMGVAHRAELKAIRTAQKLPRPTVPGPRLSRHLVPVRFPWLNGWALKFPGSDEAVVWLSSALFASRGAGKPVQYAAYFAVPSIIHALAIIVMGIFFLIACAFEMMQHLMVRYCRWFTMGFVTHEGPSPAEMELSSFTMDLYLVGVMDPSVRADKVDDMSKSIAAGTTLHVHTRVSGPEAGYITCAIAAGQAAAVLTSEQRASLFFDKGVVTSAAAMHETDYVDRLVRREIKFEVMQRVVVAQGTGQADVCEQAEDDKKAKAE